MQTTKIQEEEFTAEDKEAIPEDLDEIVIGLIKENKLTKNGDESQD
jgi:hypothetical protein